MFNKKLLPVFCLTLLSSSITGHTETTPDKIFNHHTYLGLQAGYGSTTWQGLVPTMHNQNEAMATSTPQAAKEGGSVYGAFGGYEFSPYFALEASYLNYQTAQVYFDYFYSKFSDVYKTTELDTHTESVSLMAKLMVTVPNTRVRFFSSFGVADVHRADVITNEWHIGPTFGAGFNFHLNKQLMAEIGGNYTAGWAESQLNPSESYIPFLYSFGFRLGYFF